MLIPNRHGSSNSCRYGFQGQEKDDELKGEGNSLNYTFRMHDPRVGRFFAVDPLTAKYPWYSPYQFSGNKPIQFIELEGLEETTTTYTYISKTPTKVVIKKETIIDKSKEQALIILMKIAGKTYTANSAKTTHGRDDETNYNGDFSGIHDLTNRDLSLITGYADVVFHHIHNNLSKEETVMLESGAGPKRLPTNLLDFKGRLYNLLGIDEDKLVSVDGVAYNANEIGNYVWGLVLKEQGVIVNAEDIAEIGSWHRGFWNFGNNDEPNEKKAINSGINKVNKLKINEKLRQKAFDEYRLEYDEFIENGGDENAYKPSNYLKNFENEPKE